MEQINPVTAVLGVLLCFVLSIVLFVFRVVRSLPPIEKASTQATAPGFPTKAVAGGLTRDAVLCAGSGSLLPPIRRWWWRG